MTGAFLDVGELLERDTELGLVDAALASARRGDGTALVFEGAAGIGKTALLDAAAQRARESGLRVLRGRGSALEREFGFGVALQLFELPCADERAELTRGGARLALPLLDGDAIAQPGADPFALIHGLYWLTANLAGDDGAVLIVDDLEWTDRPTLRFLNYLVQRIADLPVVLIAARGDGVALSDRPLIAELGALAAIEVRPLEPLGKAASAQLVGARLPAAGTALRHACALVTGGNPFLITELTDEIEARASRPTASEVERLAPDALRRSVAARLARLPEGSFELARAVAVLGDEAPFGVVAELADLNGDAEVAADALATAGILEADGRLAFAQTLVRATVYGEIPAGERAAMHARAADLLADAAMPPERVAIHVLQTRGGLSEAASGALREAARRAARRGAPEAAIPYLRRLLEERLEGSDRADALLELGTAEAHMLMEEAAGHLEQATNGGAGVETRAHATAGLARLRIGAGAIEEGVALLQDARAAVEPVDPELALRLDAETTLAARFCLDTHGLMRSRMAAFTPPESAPSAGDRQMLALLAFDLTARGATPVDEVVELAERALDDGRLLAGEGPLSAGLSMALLTLRFAGRIDLADDIYSAAIDAARELGSARAFAAASFGRSAVARLQGRAADAEADARAAIGLVEVAMMPEPVIVAELAFALAELDRLDEAVAELDRLGPPESDLCIVNPLLDARSQILAVAGRHDEALTAALRLGESANRWSETNPALYPWRSTAALLLARSGDGERAAQLVEEELALARAFGAPAPIGRALRSAARLARSPSAMADAVAVLERSESRGELVRALIDQGAMLRVAGQRREAREPLTRALGLAQETGLVACERQAREELVTAGARPRRAALTSGADALTPGERRVAELAARGQTNREIAQALFVTVKAVQYHLTNVYRKLGVGERSAIGAALER